MGASSDSYFAKDALDSSFFAQAQVAPPLSVHLEDRTHQTLPGLRTARHRATVLANSLCRVREKSTMREENFVPCLVLIVFLAFPRIALALLYLFSTYLQRAYHGLILPLLGFLFLPLTTLAYAWMVNTRQPIAGINLLILIVVVVIDLGGLSRGEYHRRRRWEE
jgi:uncharacterized oligopeptide transporter (OPT) family protein